MIRWLSPPERVVEDCPELDIAEAYILQDLELLEDMGDVGKELHCPH